MRKGFLILALISTLALTVVSLGVPYRISYGLPHLREVFTYAADGYPLRLALWHDDSTVSGMPRGGIVFIHGLAERGPEEPPYAMLCDALARQGFVVAAPWLRGYDSGKALVLGKKFVPSRWDPRSDIEAAFKFLRDDSRIDPNQIFVIGHSLGGGYALRFGLQRVDVAGIVSFSRLDMESRLRHWPEYSDNLRLTLSDVFGLDEVMSLKELQEFAASQVFVFEVIAETFATSNHPPVLFAIGSQERLEDRQWLSRYSANAGRGVEYHEFSDVSHWLNFRAFRQPIWMYEPRKISQVASTLARWLRGQSFTES